MMGYSQQDVIHTKTFTQQLDEFQLLYYEPVEGWLHPVPAKKEPHARFDIILESSSDDVEIRYKFKTVNDPNHLSYHPQFDMYQFIAHLASNNPEQDITIRDMVADSVAQIFHADWGLVSDFVPKASFSSKQKARMLALYKEDKGLIYSIVCYDEEVPAYFQLPISFR